MRPFAHRLFIAALPISLLGVAVSHANEVELPSTMAWTAYGTNSSGYAQAVAIGNMLLNRVPNEVMDFLWLVPKLSFHSKEALASDLKSRTNWWWTFHHLVAFLKRLPQ